MREIWKSIPGYELLYKVSNLGRVKRVLTSFGLECNLVLTQSTRGRDFKYRSVSLCKNGQVRTFYVHRLVLLAFRGPSDLQTDHINNDPSDNRLRNLRYVTPSENMKFAYKSGRKGKSIVLLNEDMVRQIRERYKKGETQREIAKDFPCTMSNIQNVVSGASWKDVV